MRQLAALLGILWAVANAALGAFFVTGSFTATTAAKEGIVAQLALLLGGVLIGTFALLLLVTSWRLFGERTAE